MARDFLCAGGGKAANRALMTARLGVPAKLIGCIGDDLFADPALAKLRHAGVDVSGVYRSPNSSTGLAMIVVRDDGDKTIVLVPNANVSWPRDAERAVAESIQRAPSGSIVAVDLEIPVHIAHAALRAARARQLCTVVDPSPAGAASAELLGLSDYLTPNQSETEQLTGIRVKSEADALRAGEQLLDRGVRSACIKLPDGGAVLVSRALRETVQAPRVSVVDKTGAGDAFAGALAASLCARLRPREALRRAVAAATFALTRYGSQAAYPTQAELDALATGTPS